MMTRPNRLLVSLALGAAALAAAGVSARAISSALKPPVPPVIAVVDIDGVLRSLDERFWREQALDQKVREEQARIDGKVKKIQERQTEIDVMAAGPQKNAAQDDLKKVASEAKFDKDYTEYTLTNMKSDGLRELYDKITAACGQIAQKSGFTMILSNDQGVKVPDGTITEVSRAITLKRILYVDPAHDITADVISQMNNAWIAAGGKPTPPPTPPAPANSANPSAPGAKPTAAAPGAKPPK